MGKNSNKKKREEGEEEGEGEGEGEGGGGGEGGEGKEEKEEEEKKEKEKKKKKEQEKGEKIEDNIHIQVKHPTTMDLLQDGSQFGVVAHPVRPKSARMSKVHIGSVFDLKRVLGVFEPRRLKSGDEKISLIFFESGQKNRVRFHIYDGDYQKKSISFFRGHFRIYNPPKFFFCGHF